MPRSVLCLVMLLALLLATGCDTTVTPLPLGAAATAAATRAPEATAAPVALATGTPQPVTIAGQGFGQAGEWAGYAVLLHNPSAALAAHRTQYKLTAFDASGAVVASDSGNVEWLLPGRTVAAGGTLRVAPGVTIARVETWLTPGAFEAQAAEPALVFERVRYLRRETSSRAVGLLINSEPRDLANVRVSAVAYDAQDRIVGGGAVWLSFVPAGARAGVEVPLTHGGDVRRVELYAGTTALSALPAVERPAGALGVQLIRSGFGQHAAALAYGFLVENPNAGYALESSEYHITAFDAAGDVVGVARGYVERLEPQQRAGIGVVDYSPRDPVDHIDILWRNGRYVSAAPRVVFVTQDAAFQSGAYLSSATGTVSSELAQDVTQVRVCALAFNLSGDIIGAGVTFLDRVPAGGTLPVEVLLVASGTPGRVELYAAPSALSEYK